VTAVALDEIQRPLRLGELLRASMKIYSTRGWTYALLGIVPAALYLVGDTLPSNATGVVGSIAIASLGFVLVFGTIARLVAGDGVVAALRAMVTSLPVLLVLGLVVAVPFYISGFGLVLLVFSALWLGLTSFAIPAAMIEQVDEPGIGPRLVHALQRTTLLARVEYWHAVGVAATLIIIYVLIGVVLAVVLDGAADLNQRWALAVAQVPLAPFFYIGLSVLYFDQRARALESRGISRRRA
jgi:hypothetical protein